MAGNGGCECLKRRTFGQSATKHTRVWRLRDYNRETLRGHGIVHKQCLGGEQPLPKDGCCNLCSINVGAYVTNPYKPNAGIDYKSLEKDVRVIARVMDSLIDENMDMHPLEDQKQMAQDYRNMGIGIMGLHDMLVKMGLRYGSEDSIDTARELMRFIFRTAVKESVQMGKEKGSFPKYDGSMWDSDIIRNAFNDYEIVSMKETDCLRNCSLLSIAPTGSISTMMNFSPAGEPYFSLKYTRRSTSLNGDKDAYYDVEVPTLVEARENGMDEDVIESVFVTAHDIPYHERLSMQSALQEFCDTAISSTVNLPSRTTPEDLERIYFEAWKCGLKGVTAYVDGSREAILSKGAKSPSMEKASAPKRPKKLPCDIYKVKAKGELFIVCVGLYENKPYEVFCLRTQDKVTLTENTGVITKIRKGVYSLESKDLHIGNLLKDDELFELSIEERAATLYTSMLLRHGINISYVIKTAKKVDDNITSFSSAMCRVLSKYAPATVGECPQCGGKLIREGGCVNCASCGYSACG